MADSPPVSAGPRTLFEAKNEIAGLREKLGYGPLPGGKEPIKPAPQDPHPPGLPSRNPPINPQKFATLDLSAMPPATFERFLSERTSAELKLLLGRETGKGSKQQDAGVVGKLYRELKRRNQ